MADASNVQTSFLGGEWSPSAQGRLDDPDYKKAMNVCRNTWPIETGAATRRAGTRFLDYTRDGQMGKMIAFSFSQNAPFTMEFTDGKLRFRDSHGLVRADEPRNVAYISQDTPAQLITSAGCAGYAAWATGDEVIFNFPEPGVSTASGALVTNQYKIVAGADAQHWFLYDALTGAALDGTTVLWDNTLSIQVARIFELDTPYTNGSWGQLRGVQNDDTVLLLHPTIQPYNIFAPIDGGNLFTLSASQLIDGPYLDPPTDGSYLTTSGITGTITLALTYPAWSSTVTYPNGSRFLNKSRAGTVSTASQYSAGAVVLSGGNFYVSIKDGNLNHVPPNATYWTQVTPGSLLGSGFVAADIGRSVRLLAEPLDWAAATAYTAKQLVTYQDAYYVALQSSTGKVPGADPDNWGVASNAAAWTWGIIVAVNSAVSVDVALQGADLLYNQAISTFRLGAYANSTSWPTCGTFHEGRFWLGGAVKNRFDASSARGNSYDFTPTAPDGTVSDANAISYTLKSPQQNQIVWMLPDREGVVMGTMQGEWLVQSSANNDPITPTSIQAHNVTKLGSANVEPRRTGLTFAFVQRYAKTLMDFVGDPFGKFAGVDLSSKTSHLTAMGLVKLAYQAELVPILWALTGDKKLVGTTFKRESVMPGSVPVFNAWHRHDLGSGFDVIDMVEGPSPDGLLDTVTLITQDPASGFCRVEAITELFEDNAPITSAWFVDDGVIPCGAEVATVLTVQGVKLSGLAQLNGFSVAVFFAGLDLGDHVIAAGQVFVPFSTTNSLFTLAYLQSKDETDYEYQVQVKYANPLTGTQTMMEFPPISNTYLSHFTYLNYGSQAITDWARDRVTFMLPGFGPYSGFVQYTISTGELIQYVRIDGVYGGHIPAYYDGATAYTGNPRVRGSDNRLYTAIVAGSFNVNPAGAGQADWDNSAQPQILPNNYNGATAYAAGNYVVSAGAIYQSLQNANTGHTPASSPTFWLLMFPVPADWSPTVVYGAVTKVTGSNEHIFWPLQNVIAGLGDPNSFATNNNPYWGTAGSVWGPPITTSGLGLDLNGDIYMAPATPPYSIVKIDGDTLKMKGNFSAGPGQSLPAPANGIVPMRVLNNNLQSETDYLLMTTNTDPSGSTHPSAVVLNVNSLVAQQTNTFVFDEGDSPIAVAGFNGVGLGQAFVLTRSLAGNASTTPIGLYEINVFSQQPPTFKFKNVLGFWKDPNKNIYGNLVPNGADKRKIGTISPSSIDPLWTFFTGQTGLLYDAQDGNVMSIFGSANPSVWNSGTVYAIGDTVINYAIGSDGNVYKNILAGNTNHDPVGDGGVRWTLIGLPAVQMLYLVKFTTDCARVLWRVPLAASPSTDLGFQFVNISNGYYVFLESLGLGAWQVRRVNTLTGFATIQFATQQGLSQLGASQVYNDTTGDVVIYPQYDSTAGGVSVPPTPVDPVGGTTPASFTGWGRWNIQPLSSTYLVPGVVGFTYTSQGQLLRPVSPAESGARNGPAFGKTRRNHRYAMAVTGTGVGITVGSDFGVLGRLRPAQFKSLSGKGALLISAATLYTGEHSDTVEGDYDLDGMLCWEITRPLPATMTAFGGFLQTQDR